MRDPAPTHLIMLPCCRSAHPRTPLVPATTFSRLDSTTPEAPLSPSVADRMILRHPSRLAQENTTGVMALPCCTSCTSCKGASADA